jgi:hypothetical protein
MASKRIRKTDHERLADLERRSTITSWAGIATIVAVPLAIIGIFVALVGIKEVHDWLFYRVLHIYSVEQATVAVSPTPVQNANVSSVHVASPSKDPSVSPPNQPLPTIFLDHNPQTGVAFERVIPFDKWEHVNPNKVRGGDSKTPGREVNIDWQAPGPVTSVTGKCLVGWCEIEACNYHEDVAHCEGWTNDGNHGTINMTVKWVQPFPKP